MLHPRRDLVQKRHLAPRLDPDRLADSGIFLIQQDDVIVDDDVVKNRHAGPDEEGPPDPVQAGQRRYDVLVQQQAGHGVGR